MKRVSAVTAALALLCLGSLAQANITIETVAVGDAGNAADTLTGYGSVGYDYNIGKYEVTAGQYATFLNAVAAISDPYGLYNAQMSNATYASGITRSGVSGNYTYSVASAFINRPVNFVSFWDSCRFANWLCNGQGNGGTETGAYTLTASGIANNTVTRNAGATWAVTSEDEWYKAAFYKGGNTNAGYWLYPTSSNALPTRDITDVSGNNANYYLSGSIYPINSPYYTTVGGEFQNSESPYGTFDQGGNVFERNDAIIDSVGRGMRGGSFNYASTYLRASSRNSLLPTDEHNLIGFRVSQVVPEPSSFIAGAALLTPLLALRRLRGK